MKKFFALVFVFLFFTQISFVFAQNQQNSSIVPPINQELLTAQLQQLVLFGKGADYKKNVTAISVVTVLVYAALIFTGTVTISFLVYGAYIWLTASGNDKQVAKARGILIYALYGLIIIFAGYVTTFYLLRGAIYTIIGTPSGIQAASWADFLSALNPFN